MIPQWYIVSAVMLSVAATVGFATVGAMSLAMLMWFIGAMWTGYALGEEAEEVDQR
jgi:hypothetical protein